MLKKSLYLIISILLATVLVVLQTTLSNLMWLSSVDMPVTIGLTLNTFFGDLIGMNSCRNKTSKAIHLMGKGNV